MSQNGEHVSDLSTNALNNRHPKLCLGAIIIPNLLALGNAVIFIFVVSLAPFVLHGQIPQLLSRLFPFKRGLNHAYWAPNVWALITALDRVLLFIARRTGGSDRIKIEGLASTSRGLVGDTIFSVLPTIKPIHTFIITAIVQLVFFPPS
jgi:alpha-1,3-glucosyltransferase